MNKEIVQYLKLIVSIVLILISISGIFSWFTMNNLSSPGSIWYLIPLSSVSVTIIYLSLHVITLVLAFSIWIRNRFFYLYSYAILLLGFFITSAISVTSIIRSQNSACGCNLLSSDPYFVFGQMMLLLIISVICLKSDIKGFSKFSFKIF